MYIHRSPRVPSFSVDLVMDSSVDFLKGTLDLMILKTLSWAPSHGYGIARWIEHCTNDVLQVEEGSL